MQEVDEEAARPRTRCDEAVDLRRRASRDDADRREAGIVLAGQAGADDVVAAVRQVFVIYFGFLKKRMAASRNARLLH